MRWTWPSALAMICLALAIVALTLWDIASPGRRRAGFLPIATTRGDRLFLGIITSIGVFLMWLATVGNQDLWAPASIAVLWNGILARWG